jgi:hypothetical protein
MRSPSPAALAVLSAVLLAAGCAGGPRPPDTTLRVWDLDNSALDATGRFHGQLVSGSGTDWARAASCRPDGACVYFGNTRGSYGPSTDFLALGEVPEQRFQWTRTYGGADTDELDGAVTLADGTHLLFGLSGSRFGAAGPGVAGMTPRPLLVRIDAGGAPLWVRTIDTGGLERLHGGAAAGDDVVLVGYAGLVGGTAPSVAAVGLARDGSLRWAHVYDVGGAGYAVAAAPGRDGGVVVAGYLTLPNVPFGGTPFLLALDAAGRPRWTRRYDLGAPAQPRALVAMEDGSLALVGSVFGTRPARSPFLLRLGGDGAVRLARELRGLDPIEAFSAADAGNGAVVLAGRRRDSFTSRQWGYAMLVDGAGRVTATATQRANDTVEFHSVSTARPAEYRIAGSTNSLGAAGLDIFIAAWYPATAGLGDPVATRIAERDLPATVTDLAAGVQPLAVGVTPVPLEALEVRTLEVPTAATTR